MATSLGQIILFRVLQGLAGGGLQPSSQGVLLDSFPPEKQGAAQTMFGVAALIAPDRRPDAGRLAGGQLQLALDLLHQRAGRRLLALVAGYFLVDDPDYLKQQRAELRRQPLNFDYIGLGLLALVMSLLGNHAQQGAGVGLAGRPVLAGADADDPVRAGAGVPSSSGSCGSPTRSSTSGCWASATSPCPASSSSAPLPCCTPTAFRCRPCSRPCFGYDAYRAGLVLSPGGISSISALVIAGILLGRGADARWLIAAGLVILAAGNYWMALMNLQISPWQVVWPRMVLTLGLGLIFAPINVAAFKYTPMHLRGAAVGLLALLRNEGGSVGTSMAQTIQERREQFHLSRVGEFLDPFNPAVNSFSEQARAFFLQQTGDPAGSQQMALQALDNLRQQQASSLAYFDVFWLCGGPGGGARLSGAAHEALGGREGRPRRWRIDSAGGRRKNQKSDGRGRWHCRKFTAGQISGSPPLASRRRGGRR